jgi:drug/metabolite transporter (DMT)-like permease
MIYYLLIIVMTIMGAVAALFLKKASQFTSLGELIFDFNLYIGVMLYFLSALLNIYVLHFLDYSIVLPLTSITYIWTMILSYIIFKEKITTKKILGLGFIFIGVMLITIF